MLGLFLFARSLAWQRGVSAPQIAPMLRQAAQRLLGPRLPLAQALQRSYADGFTTSDPALFKKFIGVQDNLGSEDDARGKLTGLLNKLIDAVKGLPEASDYRRAVEATAKYRLKVLAENGSDLAVEEVLDSHLEEVILECNEELTLVPMMAGAARARGGCCRSVVGAHGAARGWWAPHAVQRSLHRAARQTGAAPPQRAARMLGVPASVSHPVCMAKGGHRSAAAAWRPPPPPPPRPPRGADGHAMQQAGGHTCSKLAAHGNPASLAVPVPADWKPYDVPADYQVPVVDYQSADTILNAKK
jgi:hypothetical protein